MILSTSTLNAFLDCPRSYLNKQMMLPKIEFEYFKYGKEGHEVIQKHISGKPDLLHPELKDKLAGMNFPIVEEKDFDERLKFRMQFGPDEFIGFLDARNDDDKIYSDIKISTTLWTLKKFMDLMQRKVYQLAYPGYSFVGITATPDLKEVSIFRVPNRPQDAEKARAWIEAGIKAINESKFEANLNANCYRCVYRDSCEKSKCPSHS
jgi:hypothetical protein